MSAAGIGAAGLQAAGGGVVDADAVPILIAALAAVATLGAVAVGARVPAHRRAFSIGAVLVAGAIAAGNAAIAGDATQAAGVNGDDAAVVARLAAYGLALAVVGGLLGRSGAGGRWRSVGLGVGAALHVAGIGGWLLLAQPLSLGGLVLSGLAGLYVVGTVLALGTRSLGYERIRLFGQLAGLAGLGWTAALGAIFLGPHGIEVLDGYVALIVGAYADAVLAVGGAYLMIARGDAIDRTVGVGAEPASDAVAAPPPDAEDAGVEPGVGTEASADGGEPDEEPPAPTGG